MFSEKKTFLCFSFLVLGLAATAQKDSAAFFNPSKEFNQHRFRSVLFTEATLYGASLAGLNELWYKDFSRSSFHSFNDNDEWLQMDKAGHVVTSYYVGKIGIGLMKWTGVERKRAIWYGGLLGTFYQSSIELLDGFSSGWGFSYGDFAANLGGSALVIGQQLAWDEQRVVLKFSYHQTEFPAYRPDALGSNVVEKIMKDYNGQTYWLSANISSFLGKNNKFPKWLNLAGGYGANGMTGGRFNPPYTDASGKQVMFDRYREYYFSFDVELSRIKTRSAFLKSCFSTFGFIKVPAPALILSEKGLSFNAFYF